MAVVHANDATQPSGNSCVEFVMANDLCKTYGCCVSFINYGTKYIK